MPEIIIPNDMFERFCNKTMTLDDVKYLITIINKDDMQYINFRYFMGKIINTYNADVSLPSWYAKLTKKCRMCEKMLKITEHDSYDMHYYCENCGILNLFKKKSLIDNNIINDFYNFIEKN